MLKGTDCGALIYWIVGLCTLVYSSLNWFMFAIMESNIELINQSSRKSMFVLLVDNSIVNSSLSFNTHITEY